MHPIQIAHLPFSESEFGEQRAKVSGRRRVERIHRGAKIRFFAMIAAIDGSGGDCIPDTQAFFLGDDEFARKVRLPGDVFVDTIEVTTSECFAAGDQVAGKVAEQEKFTPDGIAKFGDVRRHRLGQRVEFVLFLLVVFSERRNSG